MTSALLWIYVGGLIILGAVGVWFSVHEDRPWREVVPDVLCVLVFSAAIVWFQVIPSSSIDLPLGAVALVVLAIQVVMSLRARARELSSRGTTELDAAQDGRSAGTPEPRVVAMADLAFVLVVIPVILVGVALIRRH